MAVSHSTHNGWLETSANVVEGHNRIITYSPTLMAVARAFHGRF
jgi:hypothetical protein